MKEKDGERESPGLRVHNKGTSVPAPGPAGLRGGWRMKEENEDEEEEGPQERALAWDPWPALIFPKNRLHIDLGFGRHWLQLQPPPPFTPFSVILPPPCSLLN